MQYHYIDVPEIRLSKLSVDLAGQTTGKVTVMYPCGHSGTALKPHAHVDWLCMCDCGVNFKARASSLRAGSVSSCGRCEYINPQLLKNMPEIARQVPDAQIAKLQDEIDAEETAGMDAIVEGLDNVDLNVGMKPPAPLATMNLDVMHQTSLIVDEMDAPVVDELACLVKCVEAFEAAPEDARARMFAYIDSKYSPKT